MDGQVAVFPRGDRMALVATLALPEDTTKHAGHDHERPWMDAGDQADMPDRIGLFALSLETGQRYETRQTGTRDGALLLEVPTGAYVLSAESWSPELRRAGRLRLGLPNAPAPEDVATLSDLLLLSAVAPPPRTLEEALPEVLPEARAVAGSPLAIAWELSGLGFRSETLEYQVSVERTGRNVFRRLGEFLRLADRPQPLALAWQEPAPDAPQVQFRHLALDLPPLPEGHYRITLILRAEGRTEATVTRDFEVVSD
jgi:hypothetical protein